MFNLIELNVPITVSTSAYSANDAIGGPLAVNIPNAFPVGGVIRGIRIVDDDNEKAGLTACFFSSRPSTFADNAAFLPTISDVKKLVGSIAVAAGDYVTLNSNAIAWVNQKNIDFTLFEESVLYIYLVAAGTPTYAAATDLSVYVSVLMP